MILLTVFQIILISYVISPIKFHIKEFIGLIFISMIFALFASTIMMFSEYSITFLIPLFIGVLIYLKSNNILVTLIVSMLPVNIGVLSNYIVTSIFALFKLNIYNYKDELSNYILFIFIMISLSLYISKFTDKIFNKRLRFIEININKEQKAITTIFSIISYIILFLSVRYKKDFYSNNLVMIASFVLQVCQFGITMFVLVYFISGIRREDEIRRERELSEQMASYTNELERMYVIAHGFKHDYRNILVTLSGYMEGNDIDGMKDYFYEELSKSGDIIPASGTVIKNLTNLKITPIKSLVSSKSATAQKFNIDFAVEVVEPIDYIRMPTLDLVRVVGIVLDNAIEASMKCDNPYVRFGIMKGIDTENSEVITILTTNNFTGEVPQLNRLYERGYSTKGDGRGIGLNNLKSIVDQYEYASIDIKIDDEKFCSKITILNSRSDSNA